MPAVNWVLVGVIMMAASVATLSSAFVVSRLSQRRMMIIMIQPSVFAAQKPTEKSIVIVLLIFKH
ncbi:hypothetical protein Ngar_c31300 [Candidatus Nitrososphaera gargensis Ga9.2]|uniref:Uncharacterized protein n=1 Tax=Nitrososphaera gargensis (strain Ga9.2) TaxID=1237085 RepID=K0IF99_NITGG|nr:hypothetical protein Ngar_c31300 [Candidatus Nitrososphaera gargensis Ga9.2]